MPAVTPAITYSINKAKRSAPLLPLRGPGGTHPLNAQPTMKISNAILLAAFSLAALLLITHIALAKGETLAPLEPTGERVTRTYDIPTLRHLDFEGPIRLILTAGLPSVTIEADAAYADHLDDADEEADKLTIDLPRLKGDMNDAQMVTARVSAPDMRSIRMSGRSELQSAGALDYEDLEVRLSGSAIVDLDLADVTALELDGSGSVRGMLRGRVAYFDFDASGSSDIDASALRVMRAEVNLSGSSKLRVHVDSLMNVRGSGSSRVEYTGAGRVNSKVSGSGEVVGLGVM